MNYAVYTAAALGIVFALAVFLIPNTTSATREIAFDAPIEAVWAVYTEPERQPDWRSDVGTVSVSEDGQSWTETLLADGMTIHFEIVEKTRPHRFVLATSSPRSFEGRYTASFAESDSGTIGTFTEEVTASGVLPKVMRFLFFDEGAFIEKYAEEARKEIRRRQAVAEQARKSNARAALEKLRAIRRDVRLGGLDSKRLRDKGRR